MAGRLTTAARRSRARTGHQHAHGRDAERGALKAALALIVAFMVAEVIVGVLASLAGAALRRRPHADRRGRAGDGAGRGAAGGAARRRGDDLRPRTGRDPQRPGQRRDAAGAVGADRRSTRSRGLVSPPHVDGGAGAGRRARRRGRQPRRGADPRARVAAAERSLNVEGSYRHILTDLYGFIATAIAAAVILATGFRPRRRDRVAARSRRLMLHAAYGLLVASGASVHGGRARRPRPRGDRTRRWPRQPGVVEVHDLHVWEVTSGFPGAVGARRRPRRRRLPRAAPRACRQLLAERFELEHTTLQVDHEAAPAAAAADRDRAAEPAELDSRPMRVVKPGAGPLDVPRGVVGGCRDLAGHRGRARTSTWARFRVPPGRALAARTTTRAARAPCTCCPDGCAVRWGDQLEQELVLEPGDMVYVPPRETHHARERLRDRGRRVRRRPRLAARGRGRSCPWADGGRVDARRRAR